MFFTSDKKFNARNAVRNCTKFTVIGFSPYKPVMESMRDKKGIHL